MQAIAKIFAALSRPINRDNELEAYLRSKNPQNLVEVENYVRQFNDSNEGKAWW